MPGPSRMPFSAAPDKDGYLWIPDFGVANKITRLDPKTGAMQDFTVPYVGTAGVHSAVPALDGSVWLAEQGSNKVEKWDPATQKITGVSGSLSSRQRGDRRRWIEAHDPARSQRKSVGQRRPSRSLRSRDRKIHTFRRTRWLRLRCQAGHEWRRLVYQPVCKQDRESRRENDESYAMESADGGCFSSPDGNRA